MVTAAVNLLLRHGPTVDLEWAASSFPSVSAVVVMLPSVILLISTGGGGADEAPFCLDLIWCVRVLFGSMMLLVVGLATTRSMGIRIVNRGREVFFEELCQP